MKYNIYLFLLLITLSGCGTINKAMDWISSDETNKVLSDAVLRQMAERYIESGDTQERKVKVEKFANDLQAAVDQSETMTINDLMILVNKKINVGKMKPSDRDLITTMVQLATAKIALPDGEKLTPESRLQVKSLLDQLRLAASFY